MTLARKIAGVLIAMENGYEFKTESGHTIVMEGHPGYLMAKYDGTKKVGDWVMQIGSPEAYMEVITHARGLNNEQMVTLKVMYGE